MPKVPSRNFGVIDYNSGDEFVFPDGLPGFPGETSFLPVEVPEQIPLLYLQSLATPDLCVVTLPARSLVADYKLSPEGEDLAGIGLGENAQPGMEVLCLALLCFGEDGTAAANLRAPVVINMKNRLGIQMIQSDDRYPIRFVLEPEREAAVC